MHEFSIIQALADGIHVHLPGNAHLRKAVVEVGSLEHLDEELMQAAWEAATHNPCLSDAVLDIRRVAVRVRCRGCLHEYVPAELAYLACPHCGEARPDVLEGWGVTLRTLEADVPEAMVGHGEHA